MLLILLFVERSELHRPIHHNFCPLIINTMTSPTVSTSTVTAYPHHHPHHHQEFHLFSQLHDELQINILSYVADAPLEEKDNVNGSQPSTIITTTTDTAAASTPNSLSNRCMMYTSTLTHILPYVCKKFHAVYSKSDELWKDAILRQCLHPSEPDLWYNALQNIIHHTTNRTYNNITKINQNSEDTNGNDKSNMLRQLIEHAYQIVAVDPQHQISNVDRTMSYRFLYRTVMNTQLRQVLPLFIMNGDIVLNEPYGLHLFEYRYRYMMQNLMEQHTHMVRQANIHCGNPTSSTASRTQLLQQYPIYFIHANRGNIRRAEMAVIVQVVQCDLHPDGRADIVVQPIHFVWIERSWLYPTSEYEDSLRPSHYHLATGTKSQPPPHNLFYAQVLKMGRTATNAMHYLQRQETLTNVMERLIASGIIVQDDDDVYRPNSNIRPVHINLFDHEDDDDDDDHDDDEDNDDNINVDNED